MKTKDLLILLILGLFLLTACSGVALGADLPIVASQTAAQATELPEASPPQLGEAPPDFEADSGTQDEFVRPVGWSVETHSKEAAPNFEAVFPQDEVNRLDITIDPEN